MNISRRVGDNKRIRGAEGSRGQVKGVDLKTLESSNLETRNPIFVLSSHATPLVA